MRRVLQFATVLSLVTFFGLLVSSSTLANKDMFSEARTALGKDNVKNCKHCHVKALPKADDHEVNALGEYLLEQKAEREADTIDVNWLKDYTEMDEMD
ncbi:MAG: hypothetical protein VYC91_00450 [Acidobacteriota bacterium]|nr:hypothetical protein [Acidobacteriota bacterium]